MGRVLLKVSCISAYLKSVYRKISWSKSGCIAHITSDGRGIRIGNLRCNSITGAWEYFAITDEVMSGHLNRIYNGRELAHLSFNPTGVELVVADIYGRLSVFASYLAINRVGVQRAWRNDPEDNLHALVGMMWLHTERTV